MSKRKAPELRQEVFIGEYSDSEDSDSGGKCDTDGSDSESDSYIDSDGKAGVGRSKPIMKVSRSRSSVSNVKPGY